MRPIALETLRLELSPFGMDDVEACLAMDLEPAVHRFFWPEGPPAAEEHRAKIRSHVAESWPSVGGWWAVRRRGEAEFLGWCALMPLQDSGLIEIGYRYTQKSWGQGIASEAAAVVLDHGFRVLRFDPIVGVTHPDNHASQRVLEKIGLCREGTAHHYGQELCFFRLPRAAYLPQQA